MVESKKTPCKPRGMKWLKRLRLQIGIESRYEMAKRLDMLDASYRYLEVVAKGCANETLVTIKRKTGKSWEQIGKLIEQEVDGKLE